MVAFANNRSSSYITIGIVPKTKDHTASHRELYNFGFGVDLFHGTAASIMEDCSPYTGKKIFGGRSGREGDIYVVKYQTINDKDGGCHGEILYGKESYDNELTQAFDNIPINDGQQYRFGVSLYVTETVQLLQ